MYTLTHTHSRRINIFLFGNSVSEGSSSTIVEDTEKNPETPDTRMIQTFRDLFRDE